MEEFKREFVAREPNMTKLAKEFGDVSKAAGSVGFLIKYSATPGNIRVHETFLKFAFEEANNEYLVALGKLLERAAIFEYMMELESRITKLESGQIGVKDGMRKEEEKIDNEIKTF